MADPSPPGAPARRSETARPQTSPATSQATTGSRASVLANGSPAGDLASPSGRVVLDDLGIRRALSRVSHEIVERHADPSQVYLVAIPNGGVPLARRLVSGVQSILELELPLGILDTTLYRDDLSTRGERPPLRVTEMPSSVDEKAVILVEDVVNTGRTIRAAMDALMDFGRPRMVQVVALVDRGHRELPIKIDYVGKNIPTQPGEKVVFRGRQGGFDGDLEVVVLPASPAPGEGGASEESR